MDPSLYKDLNINGLQYHYYHHPAKSASDPILLFLHGFPSTSDDWEQQAVYFAKKGCGVIVPDMLGYGGTSKPTDLKYYNGTSLAKHCIGILDAEGIQKVVVVSHDWGVRVGSRLANLFPERHLGSVFISLSYMPPDPHGNGAKGINYAKETLGMDLFSYWKFFASEEASSLISEHEDSFYSIIFTSEAMLWKHHMSPEGALKKWLIEDRKAPVASWAPNKDKYLEIFKSGGWYAPTNWYRSLMNGTMNEGDEVIPMERYKITHPVLLVTTLRDTICLPTMAKAITSATCTNAVVRELDTGHWAMFEKPHELNASIDEFLGNLSAEM